MQRNKKAMVYGTKGMLDKYNPPKLKIDDKEMDYVDSFTYLGIKLDKELKFDQQLKETTRMVAHKLYLLTKFVKYIDTQQALTIFQSKIVPYFGLWILP